MTDFAGLLTALSNGGVEHILVGGVAAAAHGAARLTQDVDVVYRRSPENIARLAEAVGKLNPRLRGAPEGLPFIWDAATIAAGLNFTLKTDLGDLDLLGEIAGGGGYENLLPRSIELTVYGSKCRIIDLEELIRVKRAAGRPRDLDAVAELEALLEERNHGH
jgi:predicted nucleotidyltransferase